MDYPRWKDGMNLHQITEALGIYDGEAGMQLSALREDAMLHEEKNEENHLTYFSLHRKGVSAFRSGHYLREGTREKGPMVSLAIALLALLLSGWQAWSTSRQSDQIDVLQEQVLMLQQKEKAPKEPESKDPETNLALPMVEVLCGPCDSVPEKKMKK